MEGIEPRDVAAVKANSNFKLLLRPANTTGYVAFNYKVEGVPGREGAPGDSPRRSTRGRSWTRSTAAPGRSANQFQPPPLWGYNKDLKDCEYDTARPRSCWQAGFPNGIQRDHLRRQEGAARVLVHARSRPYFPNPKDIADGHRRRSRRRSGSTATLQTVDWATYLDKRKNGQLPLYMLGWTGDNGDPDNFLCYFFCPDKPSREGFHSNPPLSDLLKNAATLTSRRSARRSTGRPSR